MAAQPWRVWRGPTGRRLTYIQRSIAMAREDDRDPYDDFKESPAGLNPKGLRYDLPVEALTLPAKARKAMGFGRSWPTLMG